MCAYSVCAYGLYAISMYIIIVIARYMWCKPWLADERH